MKALEETNISYKQGMQWLQVATPTVTIGSVVVVDVLTNVVEVREEDVHLTVDLKLLVHLLTPLSNNPL